MIVSRRFRRYAQKFIYENQRNLREQENEQREDNLKFTPTDICISLHAFLSDNQKNKR